MEFLPFDLVILAKAISLLSQTSIVLSLLWIARHFKRYTCPVFITAVLLFVTSFIFSTHLWLLHDIQEGFLANHIMVDLTFLFMSITLVRCSLRSDFLKSKHCIPCNDTTTKKS